MRGARHIHGGDYVERTLHVMESLTTQPCPALISTGGDPIDSTAAVGQFGRSISSQQNGDNGCPPNITCAHVAAEGLFSWVNRPSVAAGSEPSPNSVKQLLELSKAAQHRPTCEPEHFGPPAPSETAAQVLPVPMFLQHIAQSPLHTIP